MSLSIKNQQGILAAMAVFILGLFGCQEQKEQGATKDNASMNFDPTELETDPLVLEKLEQWQDQKFGFFVHWGIYSQWGAVASWPLIKNFEGTREIGPAFAERDRDFDRYFKDYYRLNETFNPEQFDPEQWANAASSAGMKYFVMVTKHHDGFCLFDTQQTDFSTTGAACPFHSNENANVTKVLFEAFRDKGISVGTYFSKPDWHNENYWSPDFPVTDHSVNYDPREYPEKWKRFKDYTYKQIEELMTGYGPIDILWLDGAQVLPVANQDIDMDRIASMTRKHQPGLIVVDRLAGGRHENYMSPEGRHHLPEKPLPKPWELCMSLGEGWSHRINDVFKPSKEIIDVLIEVVAKGGNLLLDVGPPASGEIPEAARASMKEIGEWLDINGEGIYKTRSFDYFSENEQVYYTRSKDGKTVYALCLSWPEEALELTKVIPAKEASIQLLGSDKALNWHFDDGVLRIATPASIKNALPHASHQAYVFKIEGKASASLEEVHVKSIHTDHEDIYLFSDTYTFQLENSTPGATIYYTLDGSMPDESSSVYEHEISIDETKLIKTLAKKKGYADSPVGTQLVTKVKKNAGLTLKEPWDNEHRGLTAESLMDYDRGGLDHRSGEWLGFEGRDFDVTIDLGEEVALERISVGFLKNVYESIFVPDSVNFHLSKDGKDFKLGGTVKYNISPFAMEIYKKDYVLDSMSEAARYIRIDAANIGVCPHPHFNSGGKAWLYVDEVIVE
ncbi:alpha-L-fucosidase [Echinicola marina]|uniref:alpha-L-fucosidase n=1 Tax=Echinicola marina TaxID=2859768 RepID=UPI001CF68268|nr:alpha-L-fucosidase [Echinicola marina]UCS92107.1 alpha-L-fucosidase [Echinicola marina]